MIPVLAIVGRPNVGKSTLFNCFTKSSQALVADQPGVTRDRHYGKGVYNDRRFIVIDTGGLNEELEEINQLTAQQTWQAINEADVIIFMVDAKEGLTIADRNIAAQLRNTAKPLFLVVNKTDGENAANVLIDFYELGLGEPEPISAAHNRGINGLLNKILVAFPVSELEEPVNDAVKIAFIGRPNVGKSTLINRILGEKRVVVCDQPGTTRDSIFIPFAKAKKDYLLIDTAGIRKRGKIINESVEKFSTIKALQAIESANVVIIVVDAHEGITDQDLHLLDFALSEGKALVIIINKWDHMSFYEKDQKRKQLDRKLVFIDFARIHFISALHGTGVGKIFAYIDEAFKSATKKLATPELTRILQNAITAHQPPLVHGRRIKLRYAHQGGINPPIVVIHGNQTESLPASYKTYLSKTFRKGLKLMGTPLQIILKSSANPFAGKKNILTPRQINKRRRVIKHKM